MGRCQSTPGLVESRGRVPLEDMWISPIDLRAAHPYSAGHSLFSPSPSPLASRALGGLHHHHHHQVSGMNNNNASNVNNNTGRSADSPMSATSSGQSSEDPTARAAQSAATQPSTGRQSTHSGKLGRPTQLEFRVLKTLPASPPSPNATQTSLIVYCLSSPKKIPH